MSIATPQATTTPARLSLNLDKSPWTRVRFGEVAQASKEKVDPSMGEVERYIAGEHMESDELKILRWGEVGDGYLGPAFHRRFYPGQVLYGSRRTYLRKVAVAEFDGVCANTTFVVETKSSDVLLQEFLPFVMSSEPFHAFAVQESKGSVNPYVNWSDIVRYEFTLPPLEEQKRLADLLWSLERHRNSLRKLRNHSESLRAVHIDELVAETPGPQAQLGDVLEVFRGGSPRPINEYLTDAENGLNWIKIGDVPPDGKFIENTGQKIKPEGLRKTRQVKPGDFLLSNSMSFGRPYITRIHGCIHDGWLALQDQADLWRTEYLYYLLRSRVVQEQFQQAAGGSTVKNLNKDIVKRVKVTHPTLQEQDAALAIIAAHTRSIRGVEHQGSLLNPLRSAVLGEIFKEAV